MPHCPPSVNKPNKTICNKEFVCFMGVSWNECKLNLLKHFLNLFSRRNVRDQFAWRTDSNRVSAFPDRMNQKQNHANCAAKYPVKIIHAKARSSGTKRLMMFPTCLPNPERLATNTLGTAMYSRNVEKLIHPGR